MKKFFTLFAATLMLAASLSVAPSPAQAQGPGLVSSILNKMERNRRETRSLRAGMVMQKYNAQLRDYDMSFGEVKYVPGQGRDVCVRVDWSKPAREHLASCQGQYTLYRPRLNQAIQGSTKSRSKNTRVNGVLSFALGASGAQLRSQYNVEPVGEGTLDNGVHFWLLKFTPRGRGEFQYAEVWVGDDGMPVQTRVTEHNGDSTLVRLNNVQKNVGVSPDEFKINLGAGVKIVKG